MWLRFAVGGAMLLLLAGSAPADEVADRAKLLGAWQSAAGKDGDAIWTLEAKGEAIRLSETRQGETLLEFECVAAGKECEAKVSGRKAKVSLWFNGSKLVVMETRGSDVVERRFQVAGEGDTLQVQILQVAPPGKPEMLELKRLQAAAVRKQ